MLNRGQVGQTMTWIVATVIVVMLVFLFIVIVGLLEPSRIQVDFFEAEESLVPEQEMLFGILSYEMENERIFDVLHDGLRINEVDKEVGAILDKFSANDINCDFAVYGFGDVITRVEKGGDGNEVRVRINDDMEAGLKC